MKGTGFTMARHYSLQLKRALLIIVACVVMQQGAGAATVSDIPSTNQVVLTSGAWTPSAEEAKQALQAVQAFLDRPGATNTKIKDIKANPRPYRVQLVGVVRGGKKLVWCNFFEAQSGVGAFNFPKWRSELVVVDDGGHSFWQIHFDPITGACSEFFVNGVAQRDEPRDSSDARVYVLHQRCAHGAL